jgi:hypothetical protein
MFCNNCGAEISADTKFCTFCGTPISGTDFQRVNVPQQPVSPQQPIAPQPIPVIIQTPNQPVDTRKGPGPGIASLILGIISLFISWIPIAGLVPPVIAFFLGLACVIGRRRKKGFGVWGIVLSILSIVICLLVTGYICHLWLMDYFTLY